MQKRPSGRETFLLSLRGSFEQYAQTVQDCLRHSVLLKTHLTLVAASRENKIKNIMKKYDSDGSGKLNVKELAVMLQDLAGGTPPTEEEVRDSCL